MRRIWRAGAVAAVLALGACASAPAAPVATGEVRQIVSTTSFGMCVGYCTTRLEISESGAVLIREARGGRGGPNNLPEQRFTAALSAAEWQEIAALAANTNLGALPDVIGCPDCADGGAETLAITGEGAPRTVTFDFGADVAGAGPLMERVRAFRTQLTPES